MISNALRKLTPYLAIGLIVCTYLWATAVVLGRKTSEAPSAKTVIRFAHHQLETGVREAIDALADDYTRLHPNVQIVQEAVPDGTYGQWLTTQLIGGDPPDIMQLEAVAFLPWHVWMSFIERYFVHITAHVNEPNPYNVGTVLEGVPLRKTFKDGMRVTFSTHTIEYWGMALTRFCGRVFYNKTLLAELTGRSEPPNNWREFAEVCSRIAAQEDESGKAYIPIANSKAHMPMWEAGVADPLTYPLLKFADFNRDGGLHPQEVWVAVKSGRMSLNHPALRARFQILREIAKFSQPGYTGLNRDEAVFLFIQQRAVFITGGTYEAYSLLDMAEGHFKIDVMPYPRVDKDDPDYGQFVYGPVSEESLAATLAGLQMGITTASDHPDQALDFLMYLASQKGNERLTQRIGWLPIIKGAETDAFLKKFEPNVEGITGFVGTGNLIMGGDTNIKYMQMYPLYQLGEISLDEFLSEYESFYIEQGGLDFEEQLLQFTENSKRSQEFLVAIRSRARAAADPEEAQSQWGRYWQLLWQSQILVEIVSEQLEDMIQKGPILEANLPYEYTEGALARVRQRIRQELEHKQAGGGTLVAQPAATGTAGG